MVKVEKWPQLKIKTLKDEIVLFLFEQNTKPIALHYFKKKHQFKPSDFYYRSHKYMHVFL